MREFDLHSSPARLPAGRWRGRLPRPGTLLSIGTTVWSVHAACPPGDSVRLTGDHVFADGSDGFYTAPSVFERTTAGSEEWVGVVGEPSPPCASAAGQIPLSADRGVSEEGG